MRRAAIAVPLAVAGALVAAQVSVLLLRPRGGVIDPDPVDLGDFFTPQQIERAVDFRGPQLALFGAALALQAGALAVLVMRRGPVARRLRDRAFRRPVLAAGEVGAGISVALVLVALPIDALMRSRAIDVGLATRSWPGWGWDVARSAAIGALLAGLGCATAVALMRRFPRSWWIPASAVVVAVGAALTFAGPLVIDPVFNRFERLPAGQMRSDVLELARRAGVDVGEVYVVDASKRTTAANAYVTGLGATKRVVLYDTLLRDFPAAETRLVVAHELAHVSNRDVPRALLFLVLVAPAAMFAAARLTRAWGPRDERAPGPATVPALFASVALVTVLVASVSSQLSRRVEARADAFALELTGDARTFLEQHRRLAIRNVSDPDPPRAVRLLLGTHPTTRERLGIGRAFERGVR